MKLTRDKAAVQAVRMRPKKCAVCAKDIVGRARQGIYCHPCAETMRRLVNGRWHQARYYCKLRKMKGTTV